MNQDTDIAHDTDDTADTDSPDGTDSPDSTERTGSDRAPFLSARVRNAMAGVFAALVVLALIVLLLEALVLKPRHDEAVAAKKERTQVIAAASRFMLEFNTYEFDDLDSYRQSVAELLSTKAKADFAEATTATAEAVEQKKLRSQGEVLASGIASADSDSASVLVVGDADVKSTDGNLDRHFRWQVALVKVDGTWLVDDFNAVA